jgi:hypothetical protein
MTAVGRPLVAVPQRASKNVDARVPGFIMVGDT